MREVAVDFEASPNAATRARHFATATAREWGMGSMADTIELLVSELVSNAILHAGSAGVVQFVELGDRLRVEVCDDSTSEPSVRPVDVNAPSGRGLQLVDELADAWGIDLRDDGKVIWFELTSTN